MFRETAAPASCEGELLPYPCQTPLRRVSLEDTRAARKAYLDEKMRRDEANGVPPFSFQTYPDLKVKVSDTFAKEKARIENELLPEIWEGVMDLQRHNLAHLCESVTDPALKSGWRHHYYNDKKGDMLFFTRHRVQNYHFAKSSFTLKNVSPLTVLTNMHSQSLPQRQKYSKHIAEYCVLERNPEIYEKYFSEHDRMHELRKKATREDPQLLSHLQERAKKGGGFWGKSSNNTYLGDEEAADSPARPVSQLFNDNEHLAEMALNGERNWYIEYNRFYAPSPAAHRDITMLIEKKYDVKENCYYVYGCSVDFANFGEHDEVEKVRYKKEHKGKDMYVIDGIIMFCWQLLPCGSDTICTYTNVMNPSGWAPPAIVSWFKGEVIKELTTARRQLYEEMPVISPFTKRLAAMLVRNDAANNSDNSAFCNVNSSAYDPAVVAGFVYVQRESQRRRREAERGQGSGNSNDAVAETQQEIEAFRKELRDTVKEDRAAILNRPAPSWLWRLFHGNSLEDEVDGENAPPATFDAATLEEQLLAAASTATGVESELYKKYTQQGLALKLSMTEEDKRAYERRRAEDAFEDVEGEDQILHFDGMKLEAPVPVGKHMANAFTEKTTSGEAVSSGSSTPGDSLRTVHEDELLPAPLDEDAAVIARAHAQSSLSLSLQ